MTVRADRTNAPERVSTPATLANRPATVGRDDRDLTAVGQDLQRSGGQEGPLLRPQHGGQHFGWPAALEYRLGHLDEGGHQIRLPRAPRRGTRRQAVGLGQSGQQVQGLEVASGVGHRAGGRRIFEVAPGGRVGEEQMMAHQRLQGDHVASGKPQPRGEAADDFDADRSVVVALALADVVKEPAEQQQVRSAHGSGEGCCAGRRLHQMPVDGEAVVGVALRPIADRFPLREVPHPDAALVKRLDGGDGRAPGGQQPHQGKARLGRPDTIRHDRVTGQPVERGPGQRQVELRGHGRGPEGHRRVGVHLAVGEQGDLVVTQDQARLEGAILAGRPPGGTGEPGLEAAPTVVVGPRHPPTGTGEGGHELVGVDILEGRGRGVLILEQQGVGGSPGAPVQLDPRSCEHLVGGSQVGIVEPSGQYGKHPAQRPQQVQVPLPAARLLEIGLEQEGQVAEAPMPVPCRLVDGGQPAAGPGLPEVHGPGQDFPGQALVAGHEAGIEQAERHLDVVLHHGPHLFGRAHAVVQVHAGVPHRVPHGFRHGVDAAPSVVQQQQVEVAAGGQGAAAIAAHGEQGHPFRVPAGRPVEDSLKPDVGHRRVTPAPGAARQLTVLEKGRPGGA